MSTLSVDSGNELEDDATSAVTGSSQQQPPPQQQRTAVQLPAAWELKRLLGHAYAYEHATSLGKEWVMGAKWLGSRLPHMKTSLAWTDLHSKASL